MTVEAAKLGTPMLIVDEARVMTNIARMAAATRAAGCALRPHFKTSKMIAVARAQIAAGAVGLTCATAAEIRALLDAGIADLFWNQPPAGPDRAEAAVAFNREGRVAVALDSEEAAAGLSSAAVAAGVVVPCRLEIDTGMRRAGVTPEAALPLARVLWAMPGLAFEGIFTHEGHLYGVAEPDLRRVAAGGVGRAMAALAATLAAEGLDCPVVSVGSTPGGADSAMPEGVTEARPGTYVFMDANQLHLGTCREEDCAVTVLARVLSRPRPDAAVIDAGLKAMSSDRALAGQGFGRVVGREGLAFETAYEEHGLLTGPGAAGLGVGDLVEIIPNHVCGAVNMWSRAHLRRDGAIVDTWPVTGRH